MSNLWVLSEKETSLSLFNELPLSPTDQFFFFFYVNGFQILWFGKIPRWQYYSQFRNLLTTQIPSLYLRETISIDQRLLGALYVSQAQVWLKFNVNQIWVTDFGQWLNYAGILESTVYSFLSTQDCCITGGSGIQLGTIKCWKEIW